MPTFEESKTVSGVILARLKAFGDARGRFIETFRKEWFPQRSWQILQTNRSDSQAMVLRGLHYHHKQVDYWYVARGKIRVGVVDLRPNSPTYLAGETIEMGADDNLGLYIPIGVAHGFLALELTTLIYTVDNYYDGDDEFGVAWNDPDVNLDWAVTDPVLSPRDQKNPFLKDIPPENLPKKKH